MLEVIDLSSWLDRLHHVIVGGESGVGKRSRPMHPEWLRNLREQALTAGIALFVKQLGSNRAGWSGVRHLKGEDPAEWPADLRIQDFPS
jgi:protein gp37